ncbi:MAG: YIP1 family protein [Nitrospirae bacterium]|nr:YIP1 family protein [Nitrospirota bacterium]
MGNFISRIVRAARLDVTLYEEVEADKGSLNQALAVVILSSAAAGMANIGRAGAVGIIIGIVIALVGWFAWAFLTYVIGTKLLPEQQTSSNPGELLRTVGFSSAPGLVRVLGIIPGLSKPAFFIAAIWMLIAMIIAVRQALDYKSTWRAIGVCVIGWIVQLMITILMLALFGGTAAKPL